MLPVLAGSSTIVFMLVRSCDTRPSRCRLLTTVFCQLCLLATAALETCPCQLRNGQLAWMPCVGPRRWWALLFLVAVPAAQCSDELNNVRFHHTAMSVLIRGRYDGSCLPHEAPLSAAASCDSCACSQRAAYGRLARFREGSVRTGALIADACRCLSAVASTNGIMLKRVA